MTTGVLRIARMPRRKQPAVWLQASAAAKIAGIHRWTLWQWQQRGIIPASAMLGIGRTTRYHRVWLETGLAPDPNQLVTRRLGIVA